uniref:Ig-like domain-containing protein n=1 Tax=Neogobius melanostomus TaxID=47308 RepID=A0A8C6U516_9GOBI
SSWTCGFEFLFISDIYSVKSETLTQPDSVTVQPGHTLSITCTVSYSVSAGPGYWTAWIRQPAGKGLEWIGRHCSGCTVVLKDSLKSKFSINVDSSSKTVTLTGNNMQPGDSAVYYCAREPQSHREYVELYKNTSGCYSLMSLH